MGHRHPNAIAAGTKNCIENRPQTPALKHGGFSRHIKSKYSDCRFNAAKELKGIIQRLTDDAGGDGNLSEGQRLMLGVIRSKFIVSKQISDFVAKQEGIVDPKGEILPCLKSFCTFTEGMRRAIESFYAMGNKKPSRVPSIQEIIAKGEAE